MAGNSMNRIRIAAAILGTVGALIGAAPGRADAQSVPAYAETLADALARNVKILATDPKNFIALVGAGKAALQMGDEQSAAGFFGRAEEVFPNSPQPQMGKGAALVASGDAREALAYFARAQQLGATVASFGSDRGLAYDLLGQPAAAQRDYRAALLGADRNEATRRLALSQAIAGRKDEALATLQPLLARRDPGATRVRSLVLALAGDLAGAKAALDTMIPGLSRRMDPFFRRLPTLTTEQKAAAVHLGVIPGSGSGPSYASAGQRSAGPALGQPGGDRLASIDYVLKSPPAPNAPAPQPTYRPSPQAATRVASASIPARSAPRAVAPAAASKIWLQLASGSNAAALPDQFRRIKRSTRDLLDGIDAHVAEDNNRVRLLIGPFKNSKDAGIFAEDLAALSVNAFSWINRPGQAVRKLALE